MVINIPDTISTNLIDKKPSAKLKRLEINNDYVLRYEGIKTGGMQLETKGKTKNEAEKKMIDILNYYRLI